MKHLASAIFSKKQIPLILCLAVLLGVSYFNYRNTVPMIFPERTYGQPVISTDFPELDISIEQVLQDNRYIYVLLHHSNGIVQVYDLEGNYQFSLFFYCHGHGGFSLALADNTLYVQDMRENVYVFTNGIFQRFVEAADAQMEFTELDFKSRDSSANYEIRENSVWRISEKEDVCIVGAYAQPAISTNYLLWAACFVLFVSLLRYTHPPK